MSIRVILANINTIQAIGTSLRRREETILFRDNQAPAKDPFG
jgi:hypothetical protein